MMGHIAYVVQVQQQCLALMALGKNAFQMAYFKFKIVPLIKKMQQAHQARIYAKLARLIFYWFYIRIKQGEF
jgi:hypothetical protein